ncbi:MAG: hypothetical protein K2X48_05915 [Chitinophagaceae bacterium]|nr:hypothetical protein [Chitinophagaceae bacterium]
MNLRRLFIIILSLLGALGFSMLGSFSAYEIVSVGIAVYMAISFIDSIGKGYNLFDITILLAVFQCLIMPMIVYRFYNNDYIVIALKYDMGISSEEYFSFVLPAIISMILGLKLPLNRHLNAAKILRESIYKSQQYLKGKGNLGVLLIIIGTVSGALQIFIPGELKYIAYLFGKLLYVGVIYTFFSDAKNRKAFLLGGIVMIFAQALAQGMFGELVFTLMLGAMLILLGKKMSDGAKFGLTTAGFICIILLQSVKGDYRAVTWYGKGDANETGTFFSLILNRLSNPDKFFNLYEMFPTVNRFNQGLIISKVFVHVPQNEPFAEGETIFTTLAASFVPRILWPDKPKSGGHENMERFTGYKIEGYSMNISPIGEAYANFDKTGGIIFMFFYGLFFNVMLYMLVLLSRKTPTIVLWFPILFLNSIQIETDVLMCVNSLIKNLVFIAFCYWAADRLLRLKL